MYYFVTVISLATPGKNTLVDAILQRIEAILKALGHYTAKKRTWHQHVMPHKDGWALSCDGNKHINTKHRKQSTAIRKAKTLAKCYKADVIIHRASGGIRERLSYGDN